MQHHKNNRNFLHEHSWVGAALVTAALSLHCQNAASSGQDMALSDMGSSDMPPTGGGLTILTFDTNYSQITQGQSITFRVSLTDPSDLQNVKGDLLSPDGKTKYGSFVAGQPGKYSLTLSWDQINQAQEIDFANRIERQFVAQFSDSAGVPITKSAWLPFYCDNNQVAYKGTCSDGCYINNSYWAPGTTNPASSCQLCQTAKNSAWTNLSDGTSCGTSLACMSGGCVAQFSSQVSNAGVTLYGVWGSASNDVYAVGQYGYILHTTDKGTTWTPLLSSVNSWTLLSIWGSAANDIYTVATNGLVFHSVDGGKTWGGPSSGTSKSLFQVWGSASDDVYIVGDYGTILHSADKGLSWTPQASGTTLPLTSVWGSGKNDVHIVGEYGTVLHSTDGGTTWTKKTVGPGNSIYSVWGSGSNDVYAVGEAGFVLRTTDQGATWTTKIVSANNSLRRVWGSGSNDVYAVGDFGLIMHTADGGATWIAITPGYGALTLYDVWGSSGTDVYAVGARTGTSDTIKHYP